MEKLTLQELHAEICNHLGELSEFFVPGVKLTFIARFPGDDEADVLVSGDDMAGISELVKRRFAATQPKE